MAASSYSAETGAMRSGCSLRSTEPRAGSQRPLSVRAYRESHAEATTSDPRPGPGHNRAPRVRLRGPVAPREARWSGDANVHGSVPRRGVDTPPLDRARLDQHLAVGGGVLRRDRSRRDLASPRRDRRARVLAPHVLLSSNPDRTRLGGPLGAIGAIGLTALVVWAVLPRWRFVLPGPLRELVCSSLELPVVRT